MVANANLWQMKADIQMRLANWTESSVCIFPLFVSKCSLLSHWMTPANKVSDYFYYFYGVTLWRLEKPTSIILILADGKIFLLPGPWFSTLPCRKIVARCWTRKKQHSMTSGWVTAVKLFGARSRETPNYNSALCPLERLYIIMFCQLRLINNKQFSPVHRKWKFATTMWINVFVC